MSKDQDHRKTATYVLHTANKVVTTERGGQHGGAEDSFAMIGQLWQTYLRNTNNVRAQYASEIVITPKDVAQMMVLLKIARNVHGQLKDDDFVDQAGYTALAAALAGIQAPATGEVAGPKPVPPAPGTPPAAYRGSEQEQMDAASTRAIAQAFAPKDETITHKHTEIAK